MMFECLALSLIFQQFQTCLVSFPVFPKLDLGILAVDGRLAANTLSPEIITLLVEICFLSLAHLQIHNTIKCKNPQLYTIRKSGSVCIWRSLFDEKDGMMATERCNTATAFLCDIIIRQQTMKGKQKEACEFFETVISLEEVPDESSSVILSSFFSTKPYGQKSNKIILVENMLLLSSQAGNLHRYTHFYTLEERSRFQRLFSEQKSNNCLARLCGFRIIDQKGNYCDFYIQFQELAILWVRQLAKLINQAGFHQMYQTVRKIGKGSTANVFEIRRIQDGQCFAAKVILKAYLLQKEQRSRSLNQEIQLLRGLSHPNIIKLYEVFQSEQAVYMVFQKLGGGNLVERINSQRGFSLKETQKIMRGLAQGLSYLHKYDIAHRDIKLENILFRDDDTLVPVIADFGLAVFTQDEPYAYYRCGTPGYVAPEIIHMRENKRVKVSCDIFSAGVIMHILLTNRYLFEGKNHEEIYRLNGQAKVIWSGEKYKDLDSSALQLLKQMLAVRTGQRISAEEMLESEFLECGDDEKVEVSPAATEVGEDYTL